MGSYINDINGVPLPTRDKAIAIFELVEDSAFISPPTEWVEDLVCVVNNGFFDAAGYAYSPAEMEDFKHPDGRPKIWMIVPGAAKLSKH